MAAMSIYVAYPKNITGEIRISDPHHFVAGSMGEVQTWADMHEAFKLYGIGRIDFVGRIANPEVMRDPASR